MSIALFELSARAAEELAKEIAGVDIRKALDPLDPNDFVRIATQIANALQSDARPYEAAAVAHAIDTIRGVEWASLSPEQMNAALSAISKTVADVGPKVMPTISETLAMRGTAVMTGARQQVASRFGLTIGTSLAQRDLAAERWIRTLNTLFVRDSYGTRADDYSSIAREIVARGVADGTGRDAIARELATSLGAATRQTDAYWQIVATQFANTARTFSQLGAYQDAGIEKYVFEAVMDEVTTDQCRFYHGKTFSVGSSIAHMQALTQLEDPEAVKQANPWVRTGKDENGNRVMYVNQGGDRLVIAQIDKSGVGTQGAGSYSRGLDSSALSTAGIPWPPLHGNCRSTINPEV